MRWRRTIEELDAAKQSFARGCARRIKRFADSDTEYWCCICFQNRDQREELMRRLGIAPDEKYIDGREFAKAIKRALKTPDMEMKRTKPFDRDYMAMSGL